MRNDVPLFLSISIAPRTNVRKFTVAVKTESRNPNCVGRFYIPAVMLNLLFSLISTKILRKESCLHRSSPSSVALCHPRVTLMIEIMIEYYGNGI